MTKKNKELLKLNNILRKTAAVVFNLGIRNLNKPDEKIFLRDMRKIEPSLYIFYPKLRTSAIAGFRTFYCGVDTYVPPELKSCWISDHHFLSVFLKIESFSYNLIPYKNELYNVRFRRASFPRDFNIRNYQEFFNGYPLIEEISSWIELFRFNNDENILFNQGIMFPEFEHFDNERISYMVRMFQISNKIKRVTEARKKIASDLEKTLSSFL